MAYLIQKLQYLLLSPRPPNTNFHLEPASRKQKFYIKQNVMSEQIKMPVRHFLCRDYLHILFYINFCFSSAISRNQIFKYSFIILSSSGKRQYFLSPDFTFSQQVSKSIQHTSCTSSSCNFNSSIFIGSEYKQT